MCQSKSESGRNARKTFRNHVKRRVRVGVLYIDVARSTRRFVLQQRWFGLETERLIPYDNSIANHEIGYLERKKITLFVVMTRRRSEMIVLLLLHLYTNF